MFENETQSFDIRLNSLVDMNAKLCELVRRDRISRTILEHAAMSERFRSKISVECGERVCRNGMLRVTRRDVIRCYKRIQETGIGAFKKGTSKAPSQFCFSLNREQFCLVAKEVLAN